MPKCLTCYKWTLDEQDIKIKPEDLSLDSSRAKGKISDFDRNAIEEAALLVERPFIASQTFRHSKLLLAARRCWPR
jgi:electron transfer flavoprotein alpha/beta subunit